MKNPLWRKLLMIVGLTLFLCIPLRLIGVTVWERSSAREHVKQDIAASMAGAQKIAGPVLVQPYQERVIEVTTASDGKVSSQRVWRHRQHLWLPDTLDITGEMLNQPRHRGIYEAQLYQAGVTMTASFDTRHQPTPESEDIIWGTPFLAFGVSDVRGISEMPKGKINGTPLVFAADTNVSALQAGVHAPVQLTAGGHYDVAINFDLKGMERLDLMPLGRDTHFVLRSKWPHPSFQGRYLPDSQEIGKNGFSAGWRTTFLATNIEKQFEDCLNTADSSACETLSLNQMGVRLIDPVDVYLQSERALKYGFLFVLMAFGSFLLYELMKGLRIHAVQYSLVGFALTTFFLLLVALSEHVRFAWAYAGAATACTLLLWFYVSFVLRSAWRGLGFASFMGTLFAVLYALLQSEDYALLLGSLLLFGMLAVAMILTRDLDWFALGNPEAANAESASR